MFALRIHNPTDVNPTDVNAIACKRLSGDDFVILKHQFGALPTHRMCQAGKYVVVVYDQDWYAGFGWGEKEDEYKINNMHPKNPQGSVHWPARKDSCLAPIKNILCEIKVPAYATSTARGFALQENECAEIEKSFISFISELWTLYYIIH